MTDFPINGKNKKLAVGIIGSGRMACLYGEIIQQSLMAEVVAVVGNTPQKTQEIADLLHVVGYADRDYAALWQHPLDAVVIATPEWAHLQPSLEAVAQQVHILLEKPLTDNLADAQQIYQAAQGYSKMFMLCHVLRFDPRYILLRQAVQDGELGDIRQVYMRRSTDHLTYQRVAGRFHPAYWLSPHDVDLLHWVTGLDILAVRARLSLEDGLYVDFELSNGGVARLENTWASAPLSPIWRMEQFDVTGTQGRADLSPQQIGFQLYRADGSVNIPDTIYQPIIHGRIRGLFTDLIEHFLAASLGTQSPILTLNDGLYTMKIAHAIQRSIETQQTVQVEG